jgi:hypothetical protein
VIGPFTSVVWPITAGFTLLIYGTFIWTYFTLVRGLCLTGREPLRLTTYHVDRTLSLKPLGHLSSNLSFIYFIAVILSAIQLFQSTAVNLVFVAVYVILAVFGVVMFFLPLITTRGKLLSEREGADAAQGEGGRGHAGEGRLV